MIKLLMRFLSVVLILAALVSTTPKTPSGWTEPVFNLTETTTNKSAIELGRILFYDPILSRDSTISCASCHSPYQAFAHADHALSHGIHDSIGTRNAPALMNLAWHSSFMWDGAIHHIEVQSLFPITHPGEMGETLPHVLMKLNRNPFYRNQFFATYTDSIINSELLLKTLAHFMLSLISDQSRYDSMRRYQVQFTAQEANGYALFKQHCNSCHTEPLFSNNAFENNGLPPDSNLQDIGRARISQHSEDSFKFKVPTLRNISYSYPYMHDGRFKTLRQVLQHYQSGIHPSNSLAKSLQSGINLNSNQQKDVIAFLLTLSDRNFIMDSAHAFPRYLLQQQAKD